MASKRNLLLVRGHCHYEMRALAAAQAAYEEFVRLAPVGAPALAKVNERLAELRRRVEGR